MRSSPPKDALTNPAYAFVITPDTTDTDDTASFGMTVIDSAFVAL